MLSSANLQRLRLFAGATGVVAALVVATQGAGDVDLRTVREEVAASHSSGHFALGHVEPVTATIDRELVFAPRGSEVAGGEQVHPAVDVELASEADAVPASLEPEMGFSAAGLVKAGIPADVADEIVDTVRHQWGIYRATLRTGAEGSPPAAFFFAVWPKLGELVAAKKITPMIVEIPFGSRAPRRTLVSVCNRGSKVLDVCINTRTWQVQIHFRDDEANPEPELFRAIWDVDGFR